jgi:hypothetical protein
MFLSGKLKGVPESLAGNPWHSPFENEGIMKECTVKSVPNTTDGRIIQTIRIE